jgi:hypothetical protein
MSSNSFALGVFAALSCPPLTAPNAQDPCIATAVAARQSCLRQAQSDYWLQRGKCLQLPTHQERADCIADALDELHDALDLCDEQRDARLDVCAATGGGTYAPDVDPADFVARVDQPYFPLTPGAHYVYEKVTPERTEVGDFVVTHDTKTILGVTCVVVHDIESVDGLVVEDTFDWFAQDVLGNVWYFGEATKELDHGLVTSIEGSWRAGDDGASPGIVMEAAPAVGDVYRQEFLLGEAEDVAAVLALADAVVVPYGAFPACLRIEETTPIEPDALEHKYYAPGVGLVLTISVHSGARTELVELTYD